MRTKVMIKTAATLLAMTIGLSGCFLSGGDRMMTDDAMNTPMETMDKGGMNGTMKSDTMDKTMPAPPMESMEKDSMGSDMSDTMK